MWSFFLLLTVLSSVSSEENEQVIFKYTFEEADSAYWSDESPGKDSWKVEDSLSKERIASHANHPPSPNNGTKYLRLHRSADKTFVPAIFHTANYETKNQTFKQLYFSFDYWLNSKFPEHNNIEVFLYDEIGYKRLANTEFYKDSLPNSEWRMYSKTIDAANLMISENIKIAIFGFCGLSEDDGIALDNIFLSGEPVLMSISTTTSAPPDTATTASTTTLATPTSSSTTKNPEFVCNEALEACISSAENYGNYAVDGNPCTNQYCICHKNGTVEKQTCTPVGHVFDSSARQCAPCPQVDACENVPSCHNPRLFHL